MLDESLVFHKTALGQREIEQPSHGLEPRMRRALILVDGTRSVRELAPRFRPGEVDAILEELQAKGHISRARSVPVE
jgi:hypothetical protein